MFGSGTVRENRIWESTRTRIRLSSVDRVIWVFEFGFGTERFGSGFSGKIEISSSAVLRSEKSKPALARSS